MKRNLKGYSNYQQAGPEDAAGPAREDEQTTEEPRTWTAEGKESEEAGETPYDQADGDDSSREGYSLNSPDLDAAQLYARCQELEEQHLRMLAEMENFKKRLIREKEEHSRFASEAVLADILPALDNFDLALSYGRNNEACADLITGLDLARKSMLEILARHGLTAVGEVGEPFNPEIHEALTQEPNAEIPTGHVSQLFQKGYLLKGRLLRPAKVIVSAG